MKTPQPVDPDTLMERTRAAVCFANTTNDEGTNMNAFLALFHPEVEPGSRQHLELVQSAREQGRRRR